NRQARDRTVPCVISQPSHFTLVVTEAKCFGHGFVCFTCRLTLGTMTLAEETRDGCAAQAVLLWSDLYCVKYPLCASIFMVRFIACISISINSHLSQTYECVLCDRPVFATLMSIGIVGNGKVVRHCLAICLLILF